MLCHLSRSVLPLASFAILAVAAPAAAAPGELPLVKAFEGNLAPAAGSTAKACHASYRPGTPGVSTRKVLVPPGPGLVEVSTSARGGDIDLAIFDGSGRSIAAGASPDAQEVASGWTVMGGILRLQACRRSGGGSGPISTVVEHAALPFNARSARLNPPQIVDVVTRSLADRNRVEALGLDLTEGGGRDSVGVTLHNEADRAKLRRAGLKWNVVVKDLTGADLRARRGEARLAASTRASALPSGRTTYRTLADYESELKALAAQNPGLVKLITLPKKTFGGREVIGIEIAENVNVNDGRPAFLNVGVHHAREWPAGENPMEWAYELVKGFKAGNPRVTRIVRQSRNIVVPIVNPDGFNASRAAGALAGQDGGRDESVDDTAYLIAGATTGGEYRRKNCRAPDNSETAQCLTSAGLAESGVDPNRNYGGLWGGPGADATNLFAQTYRGPGPFSEPETQNIKELVGSSQVMTLITNHTTAGLILRAPGLASLGDPVDEERGYKALGDAMAKENGYFSQKSFELYDTTGTTEDWTYNTAGGFGFTFEVYCGAPNYTTGDCDDPAFHPRFARVVEEYDGTSPQADHVNDPGRSAENPFGNVAKYDGKGNREAYFLAAESTLDERRHAVLSGSAPSGTTLRLKKTFKTETFPQPQESGPDKPILFDDKLESTMEVGDSGKFRWHVNPSTRPVVAKSRGEMTTGTPSPPVTQSGSPTGSESDPGNDGALPSPGNGVPVTSANYNDHPFAIPDTGVNRSATVRVTWPTPVSDWDITLYEDANGDGKSQDNEKQVGTSAQGTTTEEVVNIAREGVVAGKKYVLRVTNFAAAEPYDVTITYAGPEPFTPGAVEAYTLTCERGGRVLDTQQVVIDRGEAKALALRGACAAPRSADGTTPSGTGTPDSCAVGRGFSRVGVAPKGGGARFSFTRTIAGKATVSVFQQSSGRAITGERLVARFTNRTGAFTWNGRVNRRARRMADGFYVVRYTIGSGTGTDVRRVVLERRGGRFVKRADFDRRATCDALASFKLERPVFGGRTNRALNVSFRLAEAARATVTVLRGSKVVKRFGPTQRRADVTHRLRLGANGLPRGNYQVRISVPRAGGKPLTATLTARRL